MVTLSKVIKFIPIALLLALATTISRSQSGNFGEGSNVPSDTVSLENFLQSKIAMCSNARLFIQEQIAHQDHPIHSDFWFDLQNRSTLDRLGALLREELATSAPESTCAGSIITYLIEKAGSNNALLSIADALQLNNLIQREILINYKFLMIEGRRSFSPDQKELIGLRSFFGLLNDSVPLRHVDKGGLVIILEPSTDGLQMGRIRARTFHFASKRLRASKITHLFLAPNQEERDSVDNHSLVAVDALLPVIIHELGHSLFDLNDATFSNPLLNVSSMDFMGRAPQEFVRRGWLADQQEREYTGAQVRSFYETLRNQFSTPLQALDLKNYLSNTNDFNHYVTNRRPWQKTRIYAGTNYSEDWATAWEAYFYNSMEFWRAGLERAQFFPGSRGVKRRFQYLAEVFSFGTHSNGNSLTYIYRIDSQGMLRRQTAELIYRNRSSNPSALRELIDVRPLPNDQVEQQ